MEVLSSVINPQFGPLQMTFTTTRLNRFWQKQDKTDFDNNKTKPTNQMLVKTFLLRQVMRGMSLKQQLNKDLKTFHNCEIFRNTTWVEILNSLTQDGCPLQHRQFLCWRLIVNNDRSLLLQRSTHHLNCTYWRQGERKQSLTLVPAL